MAKIANLSADLVANTATFEADLKRADRALNSSQAQWSRSLAKVDAQFGSLGGAVGGVTSGIFSLKGALGSLAGAVGISAITTMAKEAFDAVGGLGELASQLGISTDTLQSFNYAATQTGLGAEQMQAAIARLTRTVGDAASGSKSAIESFANLGVNILDAGGNVRSTDDIIRDVADSLANIKDPAARAAAAVDLFGKAGQKMLPFLENGAAGIDDLIGKAKELGLVFDSETIANADAVADSMAALGLVLKTELYSAILTVGPALLEFFKDISDGLQRSKQQIADFKAFLATFDSDSPANQIQGALDEIAQKTARFNQDQETGYNLYPEEAYNADIKRLNDFIAQVKGEVAGSAVEAGRRTGAGTALMFPSAGTSNPKATETGTTKKSPAEVQAEKLAKTIADLQLQVDTFDMGEVDTKIAEAMAGIDQSLPGTKESVTAISSLIQQLGLLKQARDADAADVAEYDRIIAETDAAWQKRVADGKAIMESVRTPAEEYAATLETIRVALAAGTITQEDFNRKLDEAQEKLKEAEGTGFDFREMADEAAGALASGITDAVFEADNLNEALLEIVKTLGKMVMQKLLLKAFDVGLDAIFGESATGGPEGGLTLVGERGPELLNLPAGSYVTPAMSAPGMMGQRVASSNIGPAGGIVVNAPITIEGSAGTPAQNEDLATKMQDRLERAVRAAVDERLGDQQRSGGMLNPGMGF